MSKSNNSHKYTHFKTQVTFVRITYQIVIVIRIITTIKKKQIKQKLILIQMSTNSKKLSLLFKILFLPSTLPKFIICVSLSFFCYIVTYHLFRPHSQLKSRQENPFPWERMWPKVAQPPLILLESRELMLYLVSRISHQKYLYSIFYISVNIM